MNETAAKRHLLRLQNQLEKSELLLQKNGAALAPGSIRAFDLKTVQALNVLIFDVPPRKPKLLTSRAQKMLAQSGCTEVGEAHVTLGPTDLRILLSNEAIEDLNEQTRSPRK